MSDILALLALVSAVLFPVVVIGVFLAVKALWSWRR